MLEGVAKFQNTLRSLDEDNDSDSLENNHGKDRDFEFGNGKKNRGNKKNDH